MTTLAVLKSSVDSWLIRDDVAVSGSDFPVILLLAESDIARDIRCVVQEQSDTLTFTGRSADLPANYLEERNPFIDDTVRKFEYRTPKAIRESQVWSNGRVGSFYTIEGGGGTPGTDDRVQMTIAGPASVANPLSVDVNYYARFAALSADPDTNWLLQNHFDVYLYATLRAAAEYIQEDALETKYASMYERAQGKMSKHENRKRFGATPKRATGSPRTTV